MLFQFDPIVREGVAMRVVFFYPGEEGTYVDNAKVRLHRSGIVHITGHNEDLTTSIQNCEIMWRFEFEGDSQNVRLLKPEK